MVNNQWHTHTILVSVSPKHMDEAFVYRTASEGDLGEWGSVVGEAFAFKGGDPRRFRKNYEADPYRTPADIHVLSEMLW